MSARPEGLCSSLALRILRRKNASPSPTKRPSCSSTYSTRKWAATPGSTSCATPWRQLSRQLHCVQRRGCRAARPSHIGQYSKESETAAQPGTEPRRPRVWSTCATPQRRSAYSGHSPPLSTPCSSSQAIALAAAIQILHVLSSAIARQPESAVRGVLIVCPESELESRGAAAAAGALANGLFQQVLVDRDGHAHAGYNVPVVAIGGEKGISSEHGQECQGVGYVLD